MTIITHAILSTIKGLMQRKPDTTSPSTDDLYYTITSDGQWVRLSDREIEAIKAAEAQSRQQYV